ncbi:hypothetical protein DSL72_008493 [Monilinia vaccinii-corymbosi]|uniref:DUF7137 domain-containing protein n=1 Tax=Monilinia vaccinii-corymbosi TaxID=61207 RepID=A0A8A3PKT6_9HELO|nr:hypothetical protein DSL72_008493 [Monilinia vaccinii-corymbosi]
MNSLVVIRADDNSSSSAADNTASATATTAPKSTNTASATGSDSPNNSKSATKTSSGADKATTSGSKTTSGTSKHTGSAGNGSHTTYNATYPAGGISLMNPSATTYYKIGDYVTFAWNFTSLQATPTAVNVMATCQANAQLYTIAMNHTVAGTTQAVTWDTGAYQATAVGSPLLTQTYTLIIYDAASSITATPQAGYLSIFNSYSFGMYVPQPYVPLSDWVCATCSGALSDMERKALKLMFGMGVVTVLSFTWFVTGLGVIW